MSENYIECLVKAKGSLVFKAVRLFFYLLTVLALVSILFLGTGAIGVILAVATGAAGYYLGMMGDVEYEYLYMDKEITVDRILAQTRRKRIAVYPMDKIEILAPVNSYRLDNYKNRQVTTKDYSIGTVEQPDLRYVFYCEGQEKILISPSEEMVKVMKNANPRKVFSD